MSLDLLLFGIWILFFDALQTNFTRIKFINLPFYKKWFTLYIHRLHFQ